MLDLGVGDAGVVTADVEFAFPLLGLRSIPNAPLALSHILPIDIPASPRARLGGGGGGLSFWA